MSFPLNGMRASGRAAARRIPSQANTTAARLKRLTLALPVLLLLVVLTAWWLLRGSLPALDGAMSLPGLSAPVTIQRDHLGVVTVDAANEIDAMRALGYVHAQERFFEMDLMRRTAAGELAELFGPIAVDTDKQHRVHRMRARVMQNLTTIAGDKMDVLRAYVDGINAGLADLGRGPISCCAPSRNRGSWRTHRWLATRCISTCRIPPTSASWRCGRSSRSCRPLCSRCWRAMAPVGMRR